MTMHTRSVRTILAAAAVAGSAAMLPVAALAATAQPGQPGQARHSASAAHGISRCKSFNMEIWLGLGPGGGTAGTIFHPLEFSNTGRRTCFLFGFPRVFAVSANGHQIGFRAIASGPRHLVILRPGATAHAILGIVEAGNIAGCHMRTGAFLKVFAPRQVASTIIPSFTFTACTNRSVLRVNAVHPGTGIPGFTTS